MRTREGSAVSRRQAAAVTEAKAAASRRGGRPPQLSREMVLCSALDLAREKPDAMVSISAIARRLRVTPMALYTYFGNRDALMQAMSARLLEGLVMDMPADASPIERIMAWAGAVRSYCLAHPELMRMLVWEGGRGSAAWFARSRPLFESVADLGQEGEDLGRTMLWLWNNILSAVRLEAFLVEIQQDPGDRDALTPQVEAGVRFACMAAEGEDNHARYFDFHMRQVARALEAMSRR